MYYHPEYTDIRRTVNISKPLRKHHIETLISDIEKVKNEKFRILYGFTLQYGNYSYERL